MPKIDEEMVQFEKDLLQSIAQMKRGEHAAVHTAERIVARKGKGVIGAHVDGERREAIRRK